jgi:hypothetical protein
MERFAGIARSFTSEVQDVKEFLTTLPRSIKAVNKVKLQLNLILPVLKRLPTDVLDIDLALKANAMEAPDSSPSVLRRQQLSAKRLEEEQEYIRALQEIQNAREGTIRLGLGVGGRRRTRRSKYRKGTRRHRR